MKKVLFVLLAVCLAGLPVFSNGQAEDDGTYQVAYIARAQADSYAAWLANAVQEEADQYDDISVKVFDGQASDDTVNSLIENAIVNQFDAIIIQPNNGESQRPMRKKSWKPVSFVSRRMRVSPELPERPLWMPIPMNRPGSMLVPH